MNYLAHLVLSGEDPEHRLGGFLGDWLKGPLDNHKPYWSEQVLAGVALHRAIDAWIDQQPEVASAIALFGGRYRRLAPPVIDITFDHFLARHFSRYHTMRLETFAPQALAQVALHREKMPAGAQRFLNRALEHQLLERYGERELFVDVVLSLRHRLSRPELLAGIEQPLLAHYTQLEQLFHQVYPRLQAFAREGSPR